MIDGKAVRVDDHAEWTDLLFTWLARVFAPDFHYQWPIDHIDR